MSEGTYFTPPHLLHIADVTEGTGCALWRIACELMQRLEPDAWIVAANPPFGNPIETAPESCYDGCGTGEA